MFYKFIGLDFVNPNGERSDDFDGLKVDWGGKNSERFLQILQTSSLYAPNFTQLNDIFECAYSLAGADDETMNLIRKYKKQWCICSFSSPTKYLKEELLWAHYANKSFGAKIDFEINEDIWNKITLDEVKYKNRTPKFCIDEYSDEAVKKTVIKISYRKNPCWEYEQEWRAMFMDNVFPDKRFPIKIKKITLGRKICENTIYRSMQNEYFGNNTIEIAKKIKEKLNDVAIEAYKTIYSPAPELIDENLIQI